MHPLSFVSSFKERKSIYSTIFSAHLCMFSRPDLIIVTNCPNERMCIQCAFLSTTYFETPLPICILSTLSVDNCCRHFTSQRQALEIELQLPIVELKLYQQIIQKL